MSRSAWRIGVDTPTYTADDLTGVGAKITGGRWNGKGVPLVYTSVTQALACLETLVHLNASGLPLNRYLVRIDVPDDIWASAQRETAASLPVGWEAEPAGKVSIDFGSQWIASRGSCLLFVPSVIVPDESNILMNPTHSDQARITATKMRQWRYDPRLKA